VQPFNKKIENIKTLERHLLLSFYTFFLSCFKIFVQPY